MNAHISRTQIKQINCTSVSQFLALTGFSEFPFNYVSQVY